MSIFSIYYLFCQIVSLIGLSYGVFVGYKNCLDHDKQNTTTVNIVEKKQVIVKQQNLIDESFWNKCFVYFCIVGKYALIGFLGGLVGSILALPVLFVFGGLIGYDEYLKRFKRENNVAKE